MNYAFLKWCAPFTWAQDCFAPFVSLSANFRAIWRRQNCFLILQLCAQESSICSFTRNYSVPWKKLLGDKLNWINLMDEKKLQKKRAQYGRVVKEWNDKVIPTYLNNSAYFLQTLLDPFNYFLEMTFTFWRL